MINKIEFIPAFNTQAQADLSRALSSVEANQILKYQMWCFQIQGRQQQASFIYYKRQVLITKSGVCPKNLGDQKIEAPSNKFNK